MKRILAALACSVVLAGCSVTAADLPLPGGGVDAETYRLTAEFADALNLPEKAAVKLGGVRVGVVADIDAKDYLARVGMDVDRAVELPAGTRAQLRQATPLGEVFVALQLPENPADGPALADGDTIDIRHTSSAATVEDALTATGLLVNGGGLGRLDTIVDELNAMLDGRAPEIRSVVRELDTTLRTLNRNTADIDRVLGATGQLTKLAKQRRGTIDAALTDLGPAIDTIAGNTGRLTTSLRKAARASEAVKRLIDAGGGDLKAVLRDAGPVLDAFGSLEDLRPTLESLLTLGRFVHGASKGEAGAGEATIQAQDLLTLIRTNGPPDGEDFSRSGSASLRTLMGFLEKVSEGGR